MEKFPIKKNYADLIYEGGKAGFAAIGPLQVLFENIFTAPLQKRQQIWLGKMAEAIEKLEENIEGLKAENLKDNDVFITIALQASQIALRNHQEEKLKALRNAVYNSVLPNSPKVDIQSMFLRWIDQFTPSHLKILSFLNDPRVWMQNNRIRHPGVIVEILTIIQLSVMPELKLEFIKQIIHDLQKEGLVKQGDVLSATDQGMFQSRTTEVGRIFLSFITSKDLENVSVPKKRQG